MTLSGYPAGKKTFESISANGSGLLPPESAFTDIFTGLNPESRRSGEGSYLVIDNVDIVKPPSVVSLYNSDSHGLAADVLMLRVQREHANEDEGKH